MRPSSAVHKVEGGAPFPPRTLGLRLQQTKPAVAGFARLERPLELEHSAEELAPWKGAVLTS